MVTDIGPLVAVLGTVALIELRDVIVKDDTSTPPNFTEVVPIKPLPLIVTVVPVVPESGVKDAIFGRADGGIVTVIVTCGAFAVAPDESVSTRSSW